MQRTTLVGFDPPNILPALANVSTYDDAQDEEETLDDNDNARREEDLRGVGVFLRRHFTRTLKLRPLDEGHRAVASLVFASMDSSQIPDDAFLWLRGSDDRLHRPHATTSTV